MIDHFTSNSTSATFILKPSSCTCLPSQSHSPKKTTKQRVQWYQGQWCRHTPSSLHCLRGTTQSTLELQTCESRGAQLGSHCQALTGRLLQHAWLTQALERAGRLAPCLTRALISSVSIEKRESTQLEINCACTQLVAAIAASLSTSIGTDMSEESCLDNSLRPSTVLEA